MDMTIHFLVENKDIKGALFLGLAIFYVCLFGFSCETSDDDQMNMQNGLQPYVSTAGIGVCDLAASLEFYTNGMGMVVESERETAYYHEVTLSSPGDRGYSLTLMDLDDDSDTCGYYPDKVVFVVPDAEAARTLALANGGSATPKLDSEASDITEYEVEQDGETVTFRVAMIFDPDRYLVEMVEATSAPNKYFSGFGIGVSDLEAAKAFYIDVLGLVLNYELQIPSFMDESILMSPQDKGLEVVLMQYNPSFNKSYQNLPAKLVFSVSNAEAFRNGIAEHHSDLLEDDPTYAKDIYGYLLEIVEE